MFSVGQPHARVTDRELELTVLQLRLHGKLSTLVPHSFDGVEHEIHEHLLHLHMVGHDLGKFGGQFRAHGNGVSIGLTFEQCEHFLDNPVQVNELTLCSERLFFHGTACCLIHCTRSNQSV